jgi:hypothetical protein
MIPIGWKQILFVIEPLPVDQVWRFGKLIVLPGFFINTYLNVDILKINKSLAAAYSSR